jgi:CheY-like chemotaxis protein
MGVSGEGSLMDDYQRLVILLVEDEFLVRVVLTDQLVEEGYLVIDCASGDEARDYLSSGGPVDLLLTDVRMPGHCDGLQLAEYVEAIRPQAPIILMSSHLRTEQVGGREFVPTLMKKVAKMLPG